MTADGARRRVREDDRRPRDADRVGHRVGRDMAEVDEHPQPVHLAHHLFAEGDKPAQRRRVGRRVGPGHVLAVRQRHVARAQRVHHAQRRQRRVDRVAALHADHRRDLAGLEGPLHVVCRRRQHERVGVLRDHAMDDVDLLEGRAHGLLALHRGRHVDRPELPADAAGTEARDVGHHRRLRLADVQHVQIAAGALLAKRPGVVVVAVDDGHGLVQGRGAIRQARRRIAAETGRATAATATVSEELQARRKVIATFYGLLDRCRRRPLR